MNFCRECGAKIGDGYGCEPGEAFISTTAADMHRVRGQLFLGLYACAEPEWGVSS
jgi:hypothetical protein